MQSLFQHTIINSIKNKTQRLLKRRTFFFSDPENMHFLHRKIIILTGKIVNISENVEPLESITLTSLRKRNFSRFKHLRFNSAGGSALF